MGDQRALRSITTQVKLEKRLMARSKSAEEDYLFHLYDKFINYCASVPKIVNPVPDKRTGKSYPFVYFKGYTLGCFNELLTNALNNKWGLNCTINKHNAGFINRIPQKSVPTVQNLLKNIMPPCMLYKIGL